MGQRIPSSWPSRRTRSSRIEFKEAAHGGIVAQNRCSMDVACGHLGVGCEDRFCALKSSRGVSSLHGNARGLDECRLLIVLLGKVDHGFGAWGMVVTMP